jgi:hypothetical protein
MWLVAARVQRQHTGGFSRSTAALPEKPVTISHAGARGWHRHGWRMLLRRVVLISSSRLELVLVEAVWFVLKNEVRWRSALTRGN